jgi:outer membrane lipoprotein-sorting protein
LRSVGLLDVVNTTPAAPSVATPCIHTRLHRLATNHGEKCGLGIQPLASQEKPAAPAEKPIDGGERAELFERFRNRQAGIKSFRAALTQKRNSRLLLEEAVTEGVFLFERPDRFRWESRSPDRRVIVSDGKVLTLYSPERREAERRDARDEFSTRMALEFMASGMGQPLAELEKRFRVELVRRGDTLVLTLAPRSGFLARAVKTITVVQPEGGAVPARIVILGQKGDRVETVIRNVEINPAIPPDAFRLSFGPQVRVFDPAERKERGIDAH